ncbi:MAG: phage terminase large subunit [Actinobacteria bacterium]|nr:phage terminase large subunit [Actinomycetota bacterium]
MRPERAGAQTFPALAAAELARRHLPDFLALLLQGYERAPHVDLLCEHLEALSRREIDRLMLFMPPRHGKSLHVSQGFPAWYLGRRPRDQVILASYASELAEENSRRVRRFVSDPRFPFAATLSAESTAVNRWHLEQGGAVIAAGVGGGITGFGAHLLIIDDPVKDRAEADSETTRNRTFSWYSEVAQTRLMPGGVVLLTMTRWHADDLAGRLLASRGGDAWTVLRLPALAVDEDPLGRPEGEPLWPAWFPADALPSVELGAIDSRAFAALYQQRPTLEQGGILRRDWLAARYDTLPGGLRLVQAVDSAFKTGVSADFSVIATWATDGKIFYVIDVWRRRVEFPELVREITSHALEHGPEAIAIEDAASGQSAIQELRANTNLPIIPVRPQGSKESRLAAVSGLFEAGKVLLPQNAAWLGAWIEEHVEFPQGRHDDMVDTTSLALSRIRAQGGPRLRVLSQPPLRRYARF